MKPQKRIGCKDCRMIQDMRVTKTIIDGLTKKEKLIRVCQNCESEKLETIEIDR